MRNLCLAALVNFHGARGQFGRSAHRNRDNGWRELIENGPNLFGAELFQNDDPNAGMPSIELDEFFMNDEALSTERSEVPSFLPDQAFDKPRNLSNVDPMDPEFCCDNPTKCMCQFCCVSENITCPVDVVVAVDVCHCDNSRWVKTIEFIIHLVEELKEKVNDFRFSVNLFNEISETVVSLEDWKSEWTLAAVYDMLESRDLTTFYGRGTELHTGLENAYQQFDHDLKRKSLLVLYSNGLSLSKDAQVLEVAAKYPGPELVSVTADSLDKDKCRGSLCPNLDLLQDLTSDILIDGSQRRQFWAAKEVRKYIENKFVCNEDKCEICDCDCDFKCEEPQPQLEKTIEECELCPDVPCPVDMIFAIDMCHCDKTRFFNAQQFMIETADKVIPEANKKGQKVRFSVVQFNELAVTSTHFAEFNGDGEDSDALDDFKEKVKGLTVDAFYGMGTNISTGLHHVGEVFDQESMTQDDRDRFDIHTNKTEKVVIIFSNGNSIDSRSMIHKKVEELKQQGEVRIIPVSADAENPNCNGQGCDGPDADFLNKIKDDSLERFLDSTKLDAAIDAINTVVSELNCTDTTCENPCPHETPPVENPEVKGDEVDIPAPPTCKSSFNEEYEVTHTGTGHNGNGPPNTGTPPGTIEPSPCPALNLAFIIDGSDSISGRPAGGQWRQIRDWVADVINDLNLDNRPGMSYVSVMQYAFDTELLGQKWWPIGCDPKRRATADIEHALRTWRQMNTTTNTYKATYNMMDSYDANYVGYLEHNPFSILIIISDGEHRDNHSRDPAKLKELQEKFDLIQVVQTSSIFHNKPDFEKGTKTIPDLREKPDWMSEELAFLQECNDQCNLRFASVRNAPDANMQFYPAAKYLDDL